MAPASNPTALERQAFFFFFYLLLTEERETDRQNSEYDSTELLGNGDVVAEGIEFSPLFFHGRFLV